MLNLGGHIRWAQDRYNAVQSDLEYPLDTPTSMQDSSL